MENTDIDILTLFKDTILNKKLEGFIEKTKENELRKTGLRWNVWQSFLGVFDNNNFDLKKRREDYQRKKQEILNHFKELKEEAELNPLMQEPEEVFFFNLKKKTIYFILLLFLLNFKYFLYYMSKSNTL